MNKHWMIRRLWQAFQVKDLTELKQTPCNLGIQETSWNTVFSAHSPPAKFAFNHYTANTSVSDPKVTNTQWQL